MQTFWWWVLYCWYIVVSKYSSQCHKSQPFITQLSFKPLIRHCQIYSRSIARGRIQEVHYSTVQLNSGQKWRKWLNSFLGWTLFPFCLFERACFLFASFTNICNFLAGRKFFYLMENICYSVSLSANCLSLSRSNHWRLYLHFFVFLFMYMYFFYIYNF